RSSQLMRRLLTALPVPDAQYLRTTPLAVLDWGCAFGDGTRALMAELPDATITGLDVLPEVVSAAQRRHADGVFIQADQGIVGADFDVIVCCDRLQYFAQPLDLLAQHLRRCRSLYIALVPYNEVPLEPPSQAQFRDESFPASFGGFVRIA